MSRPPEPGGPIGVVVGNPKPGSRTLAVATVVADALRPPLGLEDAGRQVIDLAELGPRLFDRSDSEVTKAVEEVAGCPLAVIASPTYKGSYTGLLKSFLDWFSTSGMSGVTVVPLMVGAGPRHALAVEVHLRPVLVEIGATMPSRGLYILESELGELDRVLDEWLVDAAPLLRASVRGRTR